MLRGTVELPEIHLVSISTRKLVPHASLYKGLTHALCVSRKAFSIHIVEDRVSAMERGDQQNSGIASCSIASNLNHCLKEQHQ